MIRTAEWLQSIWSRRTGYFRSIIASAIMLLPWSQAFAQQSQPFHLYSLASNNATSVKGSAGQVVAVVAANPNSVTNWLRFFDTAAAPTCASSTVTWVVMIPGQASSPGGGNVVIELPQAVSFINGIGLCLTGLEGDADNTNAGTGVLVDVFYK